jgi:hypothetical protein
MKSEKKFVLFISVLFFLALAAQVYAQQSNFLNDIFDPFKGIDVPATYDRYQPFIDAFLYFVFFISVAKVTLSKRFQGPGGNALVVSIGLILAIAMSWWASSIGFNLKSFGIIAAAIFVGVIFFSIFAFIRHQGGNVAAASALGYVLVFLLMMGIMPEFIRQMRETPGLKTIWGFANIIFLIALIIAIMGIARWFRGEWVSGGTGGYGGGNSGSGGRRWFRNPEERDELRKEKETERKKGEVRKADAYSADLLTKMESIPGKQEELNRIEAAFTGKGEVHSEESLKLLADLQQELMTTANIGGLIAKIKSHMKNQSFAYDSDQNRLRQDLFQNIKKYQDYLASVIKILNRVRDLLESDSKFNDSSE